MDLGEFRQATKDLPDDTDLVVDLGDGDNCELSLQQTLPPVLEHSYCVILQAGGEVYIQLDIDARIDASGLRKEGS
jgi:hypothetical protein